MNRPARIRLRLLGRFAAACDEAGTIPLRLTGRKSCGLISYLAVCPEQMSSREELAALFWGGCADQQARQSLRQALALLRKELGSPDYFLAEHTMVRLQPDVWSADALEFERLSRSSDANDLKRAARLFGGEFLTGYSLDEEAFDEWLRHQRQRIQIAATRLCETFVNRPQLVDDGEDAVSAVEKLHALDPLREDWQRLALTLYARYRGKTEAITQAKAFAGILERELGVAPEQETRALVEQIRAGGVAPVERAKPNPAAVVHTTGGDAQHAVAAQTAAPHEQIEGTTIVAPLVPPSSPLWVRRRITAGIALAILAITLGLSGVAYLRATALRHTDVLSAGKSEAKAFVRLWRSPRLPSEPAMQTTNELGREIIPIVILPFETFGESAGSTELLADMVVDDLTNLVSRVPFMRVISRQTALTYKGQAIDVAAIAAELRVKYVLEGSMRMHGDSLRVNVELIDPTTRLPVWTSRIERNRADRYDVQDEIVGRLARELQFEIIPIESARRSHDHDAEALAFRGWAALTSVSLHAYKQAEVYFQQALERDPQNLSAQVGLGAFHARMGAQALDDKPIAHRIKARDILQDAIRREPLSSMAHFYLGLALNLLPTLPEAIDAFERSIELDPSNASAHGQMGNALIRSGRPAEGLEYVRYAMRLSPRDPILEVWLEFAGNAELELGHYPEAIEYFRGAALRNPGYPRSWAGLAAANALAGYGAEAHASVEKLKAFQPQLNNQGLVRQFGRDKASRLHEGLQLALEQTSHR